jgi:hypothetical protein
VKLDGVIGVFGFAVDLFAGRGREAVAAEGKTVRDVAAEST